MNILDLVYPKHCPICRAVLPLGNRLICKACEHHVPRVTPPYCLKCGCHIEDETEEYCHSCRKRHHSFTSGFAWAEYASPYIRKLLSEVKYHGDVQLLDYPCADFSARIRKQILDAGIEALIPVPVHKGRLRTRGYNQAEEIAARMSCALDLPVDRKLLVRKKKTEAQKTLDPDARKKNLKEAFQIGRVEKIYRRVLLVDDIFTTGSTASACAEVLHSAGVQEVYVAVLAIGKDY